MKPAWKRYQDDAADFFTSLGLNAKTEVKINGVRGIHTVDVFVSGDVFGLNLKWIVECKCWSSNIPKDKVLTLQSIIQDVGADRGILFSEIGFQSGAIKAARNTNITLTSLADMRSNLQESMTEEVVIALHWRWSQAMKGLSKVHRKQKESYGYFTPALRIKTKMFFLDSALEEALRGDFPTVYALDDDNERLSVSTFQELVEKADELIHTSEKYYEEHIG